MAASGRGVGIRVLVKAEVDLVRVFDVGESPAARRGDFSLSDGTSIDLVVEAASRIEVLEQQLADSVRSGVPDRTASARTRAGDADIDVLVLSLASDLTRKLFRHLDSGELVDLAATDDPAAGLEPAASNFGLAAEAVIERVQGASNALIVWFAASTVSGEQEPHHWGRTERPYSVRANRLNLAVARLSQKWGVCFVDADRVLAEMGAKAHVEGPCVYSTEACARLEEEFARILREAGVVDRLPLGQSVPGDR